MSQDLIFFSPRTIEMRSKETGGKTHQKSERENEYAFGDTRTKR